MPEEAARVTHYSKLFTLAACVTRQSSIAHEIDVVQNEIYILFCCKFRQACYYTKSYEKIVYT